jgi:acyl dehydratase
MSKLYADDFAVGDEFAFGSHTVTRPEIISFAQEFDPQPFHLNPEVAENSMFDGLVASGWHVVSLTNRLLTDSVYGRTALLGGYGTDEVQWHRPTRPDDTLSGSAKVVNIRESDNYPGRKHVSFSVTTRNDGGDVVLTMTNHSLVAERAEDDA